MLHHSSYWTLCNPMDCNQPGSFVHGIIQARILEWVAMPSSGDLPDPMIKPESLMSPALVTGFFTSSTTWEAQKRSLLVIYFIYTLHFLINHCDLSIVVPARKLHGSREPSVKTLLQVLPTISGQTKNSLT